MVSLHEEDIYVIEDKRNDKVQKADTRKDTYHFMNLVLWHKIVAMRCFILPLAL